MRTIMADEFVCDTGEVRHFIRAVKEIVSGTASVEARLAAIRPHFRRMMADPDWLPAEFRGIPEAGGMGKGIANWLLYRDTEGTLSLCALVLPPGAATPIHDHLAWGLVGLYRGEQDEEIYARRDGTFELVERRSLAPGDFYVLIPPRDDIHRVRTTSADTAVSIHLLTNDTGCVWRHAFDPASGEARPFR